MAIVPCPECAKSIEEDDGFCGSCGAIIDPELLDAGTGDEPKTTPNLMVPPPVLEVGAPAERPADAFHVFLEETTGAFTPGAGVFEEESGSHRADRQVMVQPQVVLRKKSGVDHAAFSPFEQHVLSFLDGRRPLARLRKKSGLGFADLKVAIGMLADRGAIEVVGTFKPDVRGLIEESELAESGPMPAAPGPRAAPSSPAPPLADARPAAMPLPGQGSRPAPMPLPGQGGRLPRAPTPPSRAGTSVRSAEAAAVGPAGPGLSPAAARAQANQLLERAVQELHAGKRPAALALVHMAAELVPGDPRIESLRKTLLAR